MDGIRNQDYALVGIGALRPHPANPRRGDVGAIARSVKANGFYGAVVAQQGTGYILAGNHRWDAARREGLTQVPVLWVECTDEEARRILLVDNRTNDGAGYDDEALAKLLDEIRATDGLDGTGWTPADLDALLQGLGDAVMGGNPASEPGAGEDGTESAGGESPRRDRRCPLCGGPGRGTAAEVADGERTALGDSERHAARA